GVASAERGRRCVSLEDVDGSMDLRDRAPALVGVGGLDALLGRAIGTADDAAVGEGVRRLEREHRRGRAGGAMLIDELLQEVRSEAGMIARHDEQLLRVADLLPRRAERVARAKRLLLHGGGPAPEGLAR